MGIAGLPDIFQAKMSALMVALEFVRAYLDDLLCLTKANLEDHLDKKIVLTTLRPMPCLTNLDQLSPRGNGHLNFLAGNYQQRNKNTA
jgi:hypothetical protein